MKRQTEKQEVNQGDRREQQDAKDAKK